MLYPNTYIYKRGIDVVRSLSIYIQDHTILVIYLKQDL